MKGLVLKILRGNYPEIPKHYSKNMNDLISMMLTKDPFKRPSIRIVLEKDFLMAWINQLLSNSIAKHEFSSTFLHKQISYGDEENKDDRPRTEPSDRADKTEEIKDIEDTTDTWNQWQPLKIKKDQLKKRATDEDNKSDNGFDEIAWEKTPVPVLKGPKIDLD